MTGRGKVLALSVLFAGAGLLQTGCATYFYVIGSDHTVRMVSRPITAPAELAWRVKTLSQEVADRMQVRYLRFPSLEKRPMAPIDPHRSPVDAAVLAGWLEDECGPSVPGTARLYVGGEPFFTEYENAVRSARSRIDILTYIFDNDRTAFEMADLLRGKAAEGVKIRLLLDMIGTRRAWSVTSPVVATNAEPRRWAVDILEYLQDAGVDFRRSDNVWLTSDHQKFTVIDNRVAFFGGMNIGDEYRRVWRDIMVELRGPVVEEMAYRYNHAWGQAGSLSDWYRLVHRSRPRRVRPVSPEDGPCVPFYFARTTPMHHEFYELSLFAARQARHHIYVECPYPWNKKFLYELCAARRRGVDVRVTIPSQVNISVVGQRANRESLNTLLRHGVRVFLYPGMTHAKAAVYDGLAVFGSANYDDLSLHKNVELNMCTLDPEFVSRFERDILVDGQDRSREVLDPQPSGVWDAIMNRLSDLL